MHFFFHLVGWLVVVVVGLIYIWSLSWGGISYKSTLLKRVKYIVEHTCLPNSHIFLLLPMQLLWLGLRVLVVVNLGWLSAGQSPPEQWSSWAVEWLGLDVEHNTSCCCCWLWWWWYFVGEWALGLLLLGMKVLLLTTWRRRLLLPEGLLRISSVDLLLFAVGILLLQAQPQQCWLFRWGWWLWWWCCWCRETGLWLLIGLIPRSPSCAATLALISLVL